MKWEKQSPNYFTALTPGGEWSVEQRVGVWMVFSPREVAAVVVGAMNSADAMIAAERLAASDKEP